MLERPTEVKSKNVPNNFEKKAERHVLTLNNLHGNKARYREIFECTEEGIAVYRVEKKGKDFIFVDFNKSAEKIEKITRDKIIGKSILEIFQGVKEFGLFDVFQRVWATGKPEYHPIRIYKDERIHGWRENYVYRLSSGEIVAIYTDETKAKQTECALNQSEARLGAIIDNFNGFLYTVTCDYRIELMNKALINYAGRDATGELCYKALHDLNEPCHKCVVEEVFEGNVVSREVRNLKDNRWYYSISSPLYASDGSVALQQATLLDITERKVAEDALLESRENLREENIRLRASMKDRYKFGYIVGKSHSMQKVYDQILQAASTNANVIVYGESGTGKELVAKAIHEASTRKGHELVMVNCGAIPENLIESEYFGYKKGAFSGADIDKSGFLECADQGSLFLDEVGEISLNMQVKLLRAIEGSGYSPLGSNKLKKHDVRIISATNKDLKDLVAKGLMREDFFYRIHIIPIYLPPLRERMEDLPLLIEHLLQIYAEGEKISSIPANVMKAMYNYHWPGNIRELKNVIQRYLTLNTIELLGTVIPDEVKLDKVMDIVQFSDDPEVNLRNAVEEFEREIIINALSHLNGNRSKTAKALGIGRRSLQRRLQAYQIA